MGINRDDIKIRPNLKTEQELRGQDYFIQMASEHTNECLSAYSKLPASRKGRYICSDLMKEIFPMYNQSADSRNLYISAVHNSSACLANEQFQRMAMDSSISDCIFLSGTPGARKIVFYPVFIRRCIHR